MQYFEWFASSDSDGMIFSLCGYFLSSESSSVCIFIKSTQAKECGSVSSDLMKNGYEFPKLVFWICTVLMNNVYFLLV